VQRQTPPVAGHNVSAFDKPLNGQLHALYGGIDETNSPSSCRFFSQHVPGLDGRPKFDVQLIAVEFTDKRKAELVVRGKPLFVHRKTSPVEISDNVGEVFPYEKGEHEAIVERRTPIDDRFFVGLFPECGNHAPYQELLRQTHFCMGWHLKAPQLHQPQSPTAAVRRIELVDTELGAVCDAGEIDQQITE
jgi:hypothetical protein